ncbi:MAG TPA: NAD(P)/FAD-dependent oxidoreductase [Candidatus Baltobacteraceae bacterium]|nr:NAD(P)/FAD-dependent oxidoreductase [Candidatus Baltobacteraceae bacterium]
MAQNVRAIVKRIVILGGGFAAIAAAQRLEKLLRKDEAELVLISRENFSLFTPMLPEVSSGALDVRHIVTPIRSQLRRTRFVLADVTGLNVAQKTVAFTHTLSGDNESIAFDHVVIAIGAATSTFDLPGVAERVFALKTLEDAGILRNRFMWLLELADTIPDDAERKRLLTLVVVGGGFTGVEAAGEMVELFHSVLRFFPHVRHEDVNIVLVEGGAVLLPGLPARMGEYSLSDLKRRGVTVITGDGVKGADDNGLELSSGRRIETKTIVWSAGVKPRSIAITGDLPRGKHGTIAVERDMSVAGHPGFWALGDCAAIPNGQGGFYPPTAQHAIREGPVLAANIVATLRGKPTKPFDYSALGMMASLGARKAVAQLPGDRVLTGFPAWFLWRSYYLSRLPGLDRKLRVAFDWTLELLFPRDISELRVYSRRAHSSAAADAGLIPRDEIV